MLLSQELARNPTSKGKLIIELRRLCGRHHTVPKLYKLEGITKEEERAQFNSQIAEIWKGRHNGEVVALKVLRAPREDLLRTKTVSVLRSPERVARRCPYRRHSGFTRK